MRKTLANSLVLIFFIFYNLIGVLSVRAQGNINLGMSVSPQIFELDVWSGEVIEREIILRNQSNVALPISVKITDFTAKEGSGEMVFDEDLQDPAISSRKWFKIKDSDFILGVEKSKRIHFIVEVPENAEPGGHYAAMLFEPRLPSFYFRNEQVKAVPIVGVIFLISVKNLNIDSKISPKLEIVEFSLPRDERLISLENFIRAAYKSLASINPAYAAESFQVNITENPPFSFILKIKNNDIYHIRPSGKVLIYNFWGKKVAEVRIPQKTILPGKTRIFPIKFSSTIPERLKWLPASIIDLLVKNSFLGKYQAKLELDLRDLSGVKVSTLGVSKTLTFFSLPWKFWTTLIFIIGLFIYFLMKYRRRIKSALKVLFFGSFQHK